MQNKSFVAVLENPLRVEANPAFCHLGAKAITLPEATAYFCFTQEDGQSILLINPALVNFSLQVLKGDLEESALIIPRNATVRAEDMVNYFNSDGSCSYGKVIKIVGSNMTVQNSVADVRTEVSIFDTFNYGEYVLCAPPMLCVGGFPLK